MSTNINSLAIMLGFIRKTSSKVDHQTIDNIICAGVIKEPPFTEDSFKKYINF